MREWASAFKRSEKCHSVAVRPEAWYRHFVKRATCLLPVAGAVLALAATPAVAKDVSGFLGGFETGCSGSKDFVRYMFSLGEKYTITGDPGREIRIPPAFKDAIGQEKVADKGAYVEVTVPMTGTYRGLPVSGLYFELAHESEHYVAAVVFDASVKAVRSALGSRLARVRKAFRQRHPDYGTYVDILPEGHGAKFHCQIE